MSRDYYRDRYHDDRRRRDDDRRRGGRDEYDSRRDRRKERYDHEDRSYGRREDYQHRNESASSMQVDDNQQQGILYSSANKKTHSEDEIRAMREHAIGVIEKLSGTVLGYGDVNIDKNWNLGQALLKLRLQADGVDDSGMVLPSSRFQKNAAGKWTNRVDVPVDENPEMNFLGLLLGPGGETQRRMQNDSGARIVIRGKGSSKDGYDELPDEPLHVFITGDSFDQVEKATDLVTELLFDKDLQASMKNQQLRKVAELSGKPVPKQGFILNEALYAAETKDSFFPRPSGGIADRVKVPKDRVGHIIGKGGETIRMVQVKTGAFVQVSKEEGNPDDDFKIIEVEGTEEEVQAAKDEIQRLLDEFNERRNKLGFVIPEGHEYMAVEIPNDAVGLLIGKSGQTIRLIIEKTGAHVQVQKDSEVDRNVSTRIVHVHGFPENVELARNEIMLLVQQHEQQMQQTGAYVTDLPGSTEKEMIIPGGIIGYIIGRGGENIKNLQMKYQSKVIIEKEDDHNGERHIFLRGLPGNIQGLEAEIKDIVESQLDPSSFQRRTLESRSRKAASANPVTSATPYVDPYYNMDAAALSQTAAAAQTGLAADPIAISAQQAAASAAAAASGGDTNLYYEYYQQYYQYYYQQLLAQSYEQQPAQ